MRGKLAALCAALLVGFAPPSAFACAWVIAVASVTSSVDSPHAANVQAPVAASLSAAPVLARADVLAGALESTRSGSRRSQRLIWRSPSGPMPSQAPPRPS
jgi:formate hydrogenlyase subunit 3/multisubunit Na+/H+ antiporter MnhD subunit